MESFINSSQIQALQSSIRQILTYVVTPSESGEEKTVHISSPLFQQFVIAIQSILSHRLLLGYSYLEIVKIIPLEEELHERVIMEESIHCIVTSKQLVPLFKYFDANSDIIGKFYEPQALILNHELRMYLLQMLQQLNSVEFTDDYKKNGYKQDGIQFDDANTSDIEKKQNNLDNFSIIKNKRSKKLEKAKVKKKRRRVVEFGDEIIIKDPVPKVKAKKKGKSSHRVSNENKKSEDNNTSSIGKINQHDIAEKEFLLLPTTENIVSDELSKNNKPENLGELSGEFNDKQSSKAIDEYNEINKPIEVNAAQIDQDNNCIEDNAVHGNDEILHLSQDANKSLKNANEYPTKLPKFDGVTKYNDKTAVEVQYHSHLSTSEDEFSDDLESSGNEVKIQSPIASHISNLDMAKTIQINNFTCQEQEIKSNSEIQDQAIIFDSNSEMSITGTNYVTLSQQEITVELHKDDESNSTQISAQENVFEEYKNEFHNSHENIKNSPGLLSITEQFSSSKIDDHYKPFEEDSINNGSKTTKVQQASNCTITGSLSKLKQEKIIDSLITADVSAMQLNLEIVSNEGIEHLTKINANSENLGSQNENFAHTKIMNDGNIIVAENSEFCIDESRENIQTFLNNQHSKSVSPEEPPPTSDNSLQKKVYDINGSIFNDSSKDRLSENTNNNSNNETTVYIYDFVEQIVDNLQSKFADSSISSEKPVKFIESTSSNAEPFIESNSIEKNHLKNNSHDQALTNFTCTPTDHKESQRKYVYLYSQAQISKLNELPDDSLSGLIFSLRKCDEQNAFPPFTEKRDFIYNKLNFHEIMQQDPNTLPPDVAVRLYNYTHRLWFILQKEFKESNEVTQDMKRLSVLETPDDVFEEGSADWYSLINLSVRINDNKDVLEAAEKDIRESWNEITIQQKESLYSSYSESSVDVSTASPDIYMSKSVEARDKTVESLLKYTYSPNMIKLLEEKETDSTVDIDALLNNSSQFSPDASFMSEYIPDDEKESKYQSNPEISISKKSDIPEFSATTLHMKMFVDNQPAKFSRSKLMALQKGLCASCGKDLKEAFGLFRKPRLCYYSQRLYCKNCHHNDKALIPARILHAWDFKMYHVSSVAFNYIEAMKNIPVLCVSAINPLLFDQIPNLRKARKLRLLLVKQWETIKDCPSSGVLLKRLHLNYSNLHYIKDTEMYSIDDLEQLSKALKNSPLLRQLAFLYNRFMQHISKHCHICGNKCRETCAWCKKPEALYRFEVKNVVECPTCNQIFHKSCFKNIKTGVVACPLCSQDLSSTLVTKRGTR